MATDFLWGAVGAVYHFLTDTQLASLANGTLSAPGLEIDNTSGAFQMGQIYVHLGSAAFVSPGFINIYIVPSGDTVGGAYPTFTNASAAALSNYLVGTIYINGSTAAQDEIYPYVAIPPGKFKVLALTGGSCPQLAASGNTVDFYPTPTQY